MVTLCSSNSYLVCWVVRHSRMWCPHDIGRDSWVWGEQETLWSINSPHKVGDEAFTLWIPLTGENGATHV